MQGDFNSDGCIDINDYGMLFSVFRTGIGDIQRFDLTDDNAITLDDLTKLETLYRLAGGHSCL
jgi:hypothetical protein